MEEMYEDLKLSHWEMVVANAMLLYLQSIGSPAAGEMASRVVEPEEEESEKPQAVIHGTQLADLIDRSASYAAEQFEQGWNADDDVSVKMKNDVIDTLSSITGDFVVQNMGTDFAEFVVRCSRWARQL